MVTQNRDEKVYQRHRNTKHFFFIIHHKDVLIMTSYCKIFIGFPLIATENLPFYQNKHGYILLEMTSLRETGGAVVMHITFFGDNMSLIKIKKNV